MNLNKRISTLIAIFVIVIFALGVSIFVWQYRETKEIRTPESETVEEISKPKQTIRISSLEDAKRAVDEIDWKLPWSATFEVANGETVTREAIIAGPYSYEEGKDRSTDDPFVIWYAGRFSLDQGNTWQKINSEDRPEFSRILIFIENRPEVSRVNRCETFTQEGKEYMQVFFSGVSYMEYYKTVAGRKIFAEGEPEIEGYWFGWCNPQKSIQILGVSESTEFIDAVINHYFQLIK